MKILENVGDHWRKYRELWGDSDSGDPVAYFCKDGAMLCTDSAEARCEQGDIPESAESVEPDDGGPLFCDNCHNGLSLRVRL